MRACDDCNYYFGETCEHPKIGDNFEWGGCGDTFLWIDETSTWCPLKGADDEQESENKCHRHGIRLEDGTPIYECIGCDKQDCERK